MKKSLLLASLLLPLPAAPVLASTISVSDASGTGAAFVENVLFSDPRPELGGATRITASSVTIRIGYFSGFSTGNTALLNGLRSEDRAVFDQTMTSFFVPIGEGLDPDLGTVPLSTAKPRLADRVVNGVSQPDRLIGGVQNVVPTGDPANSFNPLSITGVPANTRIFMIVYNAASAGAATQVGVFGAEEWLMPTNSATALGLNTTQIGADNEVFRGSRGSLHLGGFIPEPTSAGLLALFSLGFLARRRR
jgi:hypothetical protein